MPKNPKFHQTAVALVSGITGQDGSYLTELLLDEGYTVHGLVRRASSIERSRLSHLYANKSIYEHRLFLHYADLEDTTTIRRIIGRVRPDEFYHLAGQSHVGLSFDIPESTCELTAMCTLRILEILRDQPRSRISRKRIRTRRIGLETARRPRRSLRTPT